MEENNVMTTESGNVLGGNAQKVPPSAQKKKKSGIGQKSANVFFYTMVAIPILQFIIFYIIVNFNSILLAFKQYEVLPGEGYATKWAYFSNFQAIFSEWASTEYIRNTLPNALKYFAANVLIVMPLTLLFAYYVYKKFCGHEFFKVMLFLPSVICNMVIVLFYRDFVEWVVGGIFKWDTILNDDVRAGTPLMILYVTLSFSGSILLYLNAMSAISQSTIEAAKIDGASEMRTFWHIVLPSIWGTIVSLLVLAFADIGMGQANLYSIYGSTALKSQQTLGYYIFNLVASQNGNDLTQYPKAAAYGLIITAVIAPLTITARRLLLKYGPKED